MPSILGPEEALRLPSPGATISLPGTEGTQDSSPGGSQLLEADRRQRAGRERQGREAEGGNKLSAPESVCVYLGEGCGGRRGQLESEVLHWYSSNIHLH